MKNGGAVVLGNTGPFKGLVNMRGNTWDLMPMCEGTMAGSVLSEQRTKMGVCLALKKSELECCLIEGIILPQAVLIQDVTLLPMLGVERFQKPFLKRPQWTEGIFHAVLMGTIEQAQLVFRDSHNHSLYENPIMKPCAGQGQAEMDEDIHCHFPLTRPPRRTSSCLTL
jgi:hypothetical protein